MKKVITLGVCALMSLGAMAQESVLKDAKKAVGKSSYEEVVKILTPAFSDPATANNPETYFLAGKAGIEYYKKLDTKMRAENSEAEGVTAGKALLGGYDYLMKAADLDKNAAKPKYAKEVAKLLMGEGNVILDGFNRSAVYFFNAKDYANAYRAWDIYVNYDNNPVFDDKVKTMLGAIITPAVKIDIYYNMGLAGYQAEMYTDAYNAMKTSIENGNDSKTAYDYMLYSAISAQNPALIKDAAMMAYQKFGKEDSQYIGQLINGYLAEKDYAEALKLIDQAIADYPDVSQYYFIKGYILEQPEVEGDPKPMYEKAIAVDPENDNAVYQMGYYLLTQVDDISNNAPVDPAEYRKVKTEQIDPLLKEAVTYLEKAYKLKEAKDADTHDVETLLYNSYYNLGDDPDAKMKEIRGY